ncbi:MAG: glycosyltransferase family 39 protein [Candidatus Diapherotrites archaeon]|nr:glycosyltransferase family 39 protein [Candidatus Diapherotrites archaeon]
MGSLFNIQWLKMNEKKWLLAIIIFSILLRLFFLTDVPNRTDEREVFIWIDDSARSLVEPYPPGFNFFVKTIFSVTESVFWTRFVLVLFSSFAIIFAFLVAKKMFNSETGLWAASLLAISPAFIVYSTHLRAYALLMTIFLITTFFLLKLLEEKKHRIWQIGLAFFYALGFWFHYYAALFILVHGILLLFYFRHKLLNWLIPVFFAGLLALPLVPLLLIQLPIAQSNAAGYAFAPLSIQGFLNLAATFLFLFIPLSKAFFLSDFWITIFVTIFFALIFSVFCFGLISLIKSKNSKLVWLTFGMFIFLGIGFLLQKIHFWARYVSPSLGFWMIALAYGITRQKIISPRFLGYAIILGFLMVDALLFLLISSGQFGLVYY